MSETRPDETHGEGLPVRVVLRPLASPLPLGFFGLAGATLVVAGLQLGWVDVDESSGVALCILAFTVPLQFTASLFSFLARDAVAATGMGLLSGIWAAVAVVTLTSEPGTTSEALGLFLLVAGVAMWAPAAAAARSKLVPATVLAVAGVRFLLTAVFQLSANEAWEDAAGVVGVLLAGLAIYAAYATLLEDTQGRSLLPLGRRAHIGVPRAGEVDQPRPGLAGEPGVRRQL